MRYYLFFLSFLTIGQLLCVSLVGMTAFEIVTKAISINFNKRFYLIAKKQYVC